MWQSVRWACRNLIERQIWSPIPASLPDSCTILRDRGLLSECDLYLVESFVWHQLNYYAAREELEQAGHLDVGPTGALVPHPLRRVVQDEMKMDRFHADGDRIHRLVCHLDMGESGIATWATTPYPMIDVIKESYPDVEDVGAFDPTNKKQFEVE